jgi:alpha/beta superfamily hydrolase
MRNLYFILAITTLLVITLIAFAFFFFDKEKHQSLSYMVKIAGKNPGYIEIDRYKTEDKIIYKSTSAYPEELDSPTVHEKLTFDKGAFTLEKFDREYKNFGVTTMALHVKASSDGTLSFLTKAGPKFSYLSKIPRAKDVSIFNEKSAVSYIPFVDRYNFSMGGAQSFNILYRPPGLLPPARSKIIFTSIRDEYIDALGKKIKTECLVVRGKGIPEARLWVSKKDRSIVKLETRSKSISIKRLASLPENAVYRFKPYATEDAVSHNIIFPSEDIALAGTISIPEKEGKLAALLLVGGEWAYDRQNAGLYTDISRELVRAGYIVLRFDKRGIGQSQGSFMATSISDEIRDTESALWFLMNHERVDKDKVFLVAHGSACSYLPKLDFSKFPVKGLIMLGITRALPLLDFECEDARGKIKLLTEIEENYAETLELLKKETMGLVKTTEKEYVFLDGKRVFFKRMRELSLLKPSEIFAKLERPLMIIYGKRDIFGSLDYIKSLKKALKEAEATRPFQVVGPKGSGHFLGEIVDEKDKPKHYKVNREVLKTIMAWVDKHLTI